MTGEPLPPTAAEVAQLRDELKQLRDARGGADARVEALEKKLEKLQKDYDDAAAALKKALGGGGLLSAF